LYCNLQHHSNVVNYYQTQLPDGPFFGQISEIWPRFKLIGLKNFSWPFSLVLASSQVGWPYKFCLAFWLFFSLFLHWNRLFWRKILPFHFFGNTFAKFLW